MKKKIWASIGIAVLVLLVTGLVFCALRPELVGEAFRMLFRNELPY